MDPPTERSPPTMLNLSGIPALDVAIGLALMFFLLATVCSSINEGIASVLGWRAKTLEDAIRSMLNEPEVKGAAKQAGAEVAEQAEQLTGRLFKHWRIAALVRDPASSKRRRNRPSYLPPRAFSRALAELIAVLPQHPLTGTPAPPAGQTPPAAPAAAGQTPPGTSAPAGRASSATSTDAGGAPGEPHPPEAALENATAQATAQATLWEKSDEEILAALRQAVTHLPNAQVRALVGRAAEDAVKTLDDFRARVETAFNDAMERASGWYKRKVQLAIALIASAVVIGLNVDTVKVATTLSNDATVRSAVAARASAAGKDPVGAADAIDEVKQLKLPVGWGANGPQGTDRAATNLPLWILNRLPGWLLTIAALGLGAPFWFDLLSRLARLRGSGVPEKPRSLSDTAGAAGT